MNRLHAEQRRLYLVADPCRENDTLIDSHGRVRALVVDVAQQAGWDAVAALYHGIQNELELPTPAIAVSGGAGYQVWLSLVEPVPVVQAHVFLAALCQRFLSQVPARHVQCMLHVQQDGHAHLVPALQGETGRWSAFVAPGLTSISPSELLRASHELRPHEKPMVHEINTVGAAQNAWDSGAVPVPRSLETDPRRFLLSVMNDPSIEMALRIEAAKALLP